MNSSTTLIAFACLIVGGAAGWFLHTDAEANDPAAAVEARDAEPAVEPAPEAEADAKPVVETDPSPVTLGRDRTELEAMRTELNKERALRRRAESEVELLRHTLATLKSVKPAEADAVSAPAATAPHYSYETYDKVLQSMDWKEAGASVAKMGSLLVQLSDAMANEKPYIQIAGDIQRHNGALMQVAGAAREGGVPGAGVNGSFTHPSILTNLVYATLREAGMPLDEAQEERLKQLGSEFVEEDARRLAGYGEQILGMQKLVEETDLKDRFYAAIDQLVTGKQREILHPKALRGRVTFDLFSSGLVYAQRIAPLKYQTQEDLEATLVDKAMRGFNIATDQKSIVEAAVADWARSFPNGFLAAPSDSLELQGRFKIERVRVAARASLAFYQALLNRLPADAASLSKLREVSTVGLPLKRP